MIELMEKVVITTTKEEKRPAMDKKKMIEQIVALLNAASCREVELVLVMLKQLTRR